jgi:pimeloyl-ACP methyl ester carboxylesterase
MPFRLTRIEGRFMFRFVFIAVLVLAAATPRHAAAEYAWVSSVKTATWGAANKIGQCWDDCTEACSETARGWLRQSVDYLAPTAREEAGRRYGLRLPEKLKTDDKLVVLIQGLDSSTDYWHDLAPLLMQEGYAVAWFAYPNDQPLADSATLLAAEMERWRVAHPRLKADLVCHSMGGIIARAYLEGDQYAGGVRKLLLLAPPNHGSCYSRFSVGCDAVEHFRLWQSDPDWSWTWMITDGLGEARRDLAPGSRFLADLNGRPRRPGVHYTIVAGNRSCGWRYAGTALRWSAACLPGTQWANTVAAKVNGWATDLESRPALNDGLVEIENAILPGVDDVVIVPADHTTIACSRSGRAPVAWPIIKARLASARRK